MNGLTDDERKSLEASLIGYKTQVSDLTKKAGALTKRADAAGGFGQLTAELSSFFVRINGGVVKVERASGDTIIGTPILPLKSQEPAGTGSWQLERLLTGEDGRRINDKQAVWLKQMHVRHQNG